jgi:serine/threonine protein kinase
MADSSWERNPVDKLADEFLERFRRGENPSVTDYADKHPDLADEIRDLFPALVMMEELKPPAPEGTATTGERPGPDGKKLERLGDFRILREVGRGGMGIVYEAEQESLGRRVALKVLPSQALLDPRQQKRFQREARAAARLHHTNIVPVFGVGEHDGLHYYVMQFIQGLGLDQVLRELKRLRKTRTPAEEPPPGPETGSAGNVAQALLTGKFAAATSPSGGSGEAARSLMPVTVPYTALPGSSASGSSSSPVLPGRSDASSLSDSGRHYWQSVARIGIQVADALDYAHSQGVLHRDIKPSNLLLDNQGTVWVTDFGLAKATAADGDDLTHTGDIIGTLRYMAPERFRGQSDAGGDIYALGLTLYEMLVLRPAFDESDRQRLIHQVTHEEPPRPRKLNRAIPRDLETIVLKATERDPARRYRTPRELAEDLQRFVEDKPIRARQVSQTERLWRWCRRNPALAGATVAVGRANAAADRRPVSATGLRDGHGVRRRGPAARDPE